MDQSNCRTNLRQQQRILDCRIAAANYTNIFAGEKLRSRAADSIIPFPANSFSPGTPNSRGLTPVAITIAID
jgi:hypothetical protein